MRWVITAVLFLLLLALDATLAPYISLFGATPDLLVILIVEFALVMPRLDSVVWAWCIGLISDLHDGNPTGVLALTYAVITLVIRSLRSQLFAGHLVTRLLLVAVADVLQYLALMFSQIIRGHPVGFLLFWRQAFLGVVYTTVVAAGLLPLLSLALRPLYEKRRRR